MRPVILLGLLVAASPCFGAATVHLLSTASLVRVRSRAGARGGCSETSSTTVQDYTYLLASTTANASGTSDAMTPTSTAPPCDFQAGSGNNWLWWITAPLSAGFTIAGNITVVMSGAESAVQLNGGGDMLIYKWDGRRGGITSLIFDSATTTEWAGTSCGRIAIAAAAPTSTTVVTGDRLVFIPRNQNVGTWNGNGVRTSTICYNGAAAGANELSAAFTETLTFSADSAVLTTEWLARRVWEGLFVSPAQAMGVQ